MLDQPLGGDIRHHRITAKVSLAILYRSAKDSASLSSVPVAGRCDSASITMEIG